MISATATQPPTDNATETLANETNSNDRANGADGELRRRIISFLAGRNVPSLRHVQVDVSEGVVTLQGRVYTFYEKQLCLQCCRRVSGVVRLNNTVEVIAALPGAATVV